VTQQKTTKKGAGKKSDVKTNKTKVEKFTLDKPEQPMGRGHNHRVKVATPSGMKRLEKGLACKKLEFEVQTIFGDRCVGVEAKPHTHYWKTNKDKSKELVLKPASLVLSVPKGTADKTELAKLTKHIHGIYFQIEKTKIDKESPEFDSYILLSDEAGCLPVFVPSEDWIRLGFEWGMDMVHFMRYSVKGKAQALAVKAEMEKTK
jgi:hypothetical protein